ncbi:MAG: restriction endonuclease subunit S [Nostoc sp. DedQUE11]|nr:restriction endonuclease subunit S [Nostoc sp. DedQUE11]
MSEELTELPECWKWTVLDNICEKITDGEHLTPTLTTFGIPLLSAKDVRDWELDFSATKFVSEEVAKKSRARCNPEKDDILVVSRGATVGRTCRVTSDEVFCLMGSVLLFKLYKSVVEPRFVEFFFKSPFGTRTLRSMSGASAQQAIYIRDMKGFLIPFPPLDEQKRIVAKIEELNDRTQKTKEALDSIPQLCDRFRQSVLAAAFRGDLTADWRELNPDVEPASVLLERIRRDRRCRWEELEVAKMESKGKVVEEFKWKEKYQEPDPLDNFDLPELPNGWVWTKWEQVGFCQNGRAFPSKEYQTNGVKLLRPGNLHVSGEIEWNDANTRYLSEDWAEQYPDYLINTNELVINLTAQSLADEFLGRICLTGEGERCLLNQRIARLIPIIISPRFLFWLFKSKLFRSYVDGLNTGSLIQHIFTPQINEFHFPLPPLQEQQIIVNLIETQINSIENIGLKAGQMQKTFPNLNQSILAKAFRGELVPQDPDDEPASVLLERIRAERDKLNNSKPKSDRTSKRKRKTVEDQGVLPGFE